MISAEEMVPKVKAAVDARSDPDFIIIARTDAAATHGVERSDTAAQSSTPRPARICMYADALLSKDDIEKVAKSVPKPLSSTWAWACARARRRR